MSVTINQQALDFLLNDPAGPLGISVARKANHIAGNYEAVINIVWENQDPTVKPAVDFAVSVEEDGLQAVVGILPGGGSGRISDYMDAKFVDEKDRIVPALMQGWESQ